MQAAKQKGPKDEAAGLAQKLDRINAALDEANKKAVNASRSADNAEKEAAPLRPKIADFQVQPRLQVLVFN